MLGGDIMLSMKQLNMQQIKEVHQCYLVHDFPIEEQKPLEFIESLVNKKVYICYGLYKEENLVAYAFFCKGTESNCILLDFLAVVKEYRSDGYGSKFLKMMQETLTDYDGIIFEVESGKSAKNSEEQIVCERRIDFYHRNGVRDTDNYCLYFGVDMIIMYMTLVRELDDDTIDKNLDNIYHTMFTPEIYSANVILRKEKIQIID